MKLVSKEQCPVTVRDRLVKNLASQDNALCDMRLALETAEAKCLELNEENEKLEWEHLEALGTVGELQRELENCNKENEELEQYVAHAKNKIFDLEGGIKELQDEIGMLQAELAEKYKR